MEELKVTCEKCQSPAIEYVGPLCGVEVWKCPSCGHVERYPISESEVGIFEYAM